MSNKVSLIEKLLFINLNYINIKNCNNNYNISNKIDNKVFFIKIISFIYFNFNHIKSKNYNNNNKDNNYNIRYAIGIKKFYLEN